MIVEPHTVEEGPQDLINTSPTKSTQSQAEQFDANSVILQAIHALSIKLDNMYQLIKTGIEELKVSTSSAPAPYVDLSSVEEKLDKLSEEFERYKLDQSLDKKERKIGMNGLTTNQNKTNLKPNSSKITKSVKEIHKSSIDVDTSLEEAKKVLLGHLESDLFVKISFENGLKSASKKFDPFNKELEGVGDGLERMKELVKKLAILPGKTSCNPVDFGVNNDDDKKGKKRKRTRLSKGVQSSNSS